MMEKLLEIELGKILSSKNDKSKQIKSSEYLPNGAFPVVDQSEKFICGYFDDEAKVITKDLPITVFGDHTRHVKFIEFPFICGADGTQLLKPIDGYRDKYFYYIVQRAAGLIGNYGYDRHFKHLIEFKVKVTDDISEQTRIVEILSTADEAMVQTEALIAKYQRIKSGLIQDLLTRGIDANGNIRRKATHRFVVKNGIEVPEEWEVVGLEDAAHVVMGQSPNGKTYNKEGKGIPLINGPVEFGERYPVKIQWTTSPTKFCNYGDILFCVRGSTTGRMNISNDSYCIGRGIAALRGKDKICLTPFLEYQMIRTAEEILSEAKGSGSTFPSITGDRLKRTLLKLPDIDEQEKIVERLEAATSEINILKHNFAKLHFLKTGLMQDLLSGRVRVNNQ